MYVNCSECGTRNGINATGVRPMLKPAPINRANQEGLEACLKLVGVICGGIVVVVLLVIGLLRAMDG